MWLAVMKFLALQSLVLGAKIRHQVPAYLQVKLKAESFVSSDTKVGELGGAKLFDASGNCISCSSPMLYSLEATPNKKGTVNEEAVPGENISFPVNSSSVYDVLMDLPMSKVTDDLNFSIQVLSAVSATGKNTEEQKGRQVSKWSVQMVLHSTTQKAVVHTGVKVSGDFSKAIDGVSAAGREEAQGPVCARPKDIANYTIMELSTSVERFAVTVGCAAGFVGEAVAKVCAKAGETPTETSFQQSQDIWTNIPGRFLGDEGVVPPTSATPFFEASVDFDVSKVLDPIITSKWFDWVLDTGVLDFLSKT